MAQRGRSVQTQLAEIASRLDDLEKRLAGGIAGDEAYDTHVGADQTAPRYCCVPAEPPREFAAGISDERARAILSMGNKWVNGTPLRYYFYRSGRYGGNEAQSAVARRAFDVWKNVGIGLTFTEVATPGNAEIRIGFDHSDGSWSRIGTGVLNAGPGERTMNFGWNLDVPGPNGLDTAIHEIGHSLGFHHEHQNPNAGIVWNTQAVYDHFATTQSPPWDRGTTDFNILRKINPQSVSGSSWDPNSIMHYAFEAGLIQLPSQYQNGLRPAGGLSAGDKEVVRRFYPADGGVVSGPQLRAGESQFVNIGPGEQKDFAFLPTESRRFRFQTFGEFDTVMVLFEETGSQMTYISGDDDSGFDRNASFVVRLQEGRRYRLKIRLYYSTAAGHQSVMVW